MFRTTITGIRRCFFTFSSSPSGSPTVTKKYVEALKNHGVRDVNIAMLLEKSVALESSDDKKKCDNDLAMVVSTAFCVLRHHRHSVTEMLDIAEAAIFGEDNELLTKYVVAGAMKKRFAIPRTFFGDP